MPRFHDGAGRIRRPAPSWIMRYPEDRGRHSPERVRPWTSGGWVRDSRCLGEGGPIRRARLPSGVEPASTARSGSRYSPATSPLLGDGVVAEELPFRRAAGGDRQVREPDPAVSARPRSPSYRLPNRGTGRCRPRCPSRTGPPFPPAHSGQPVPWGRPGPATRQATAARARWSPATRCRRWSCDREATGSRTIRGRPLHAGPAYAARCHQVGKRRNPGLGRGFCGWWWTILGLNQ